MTPRSVVRADAVTRKFGSVTAVDTVSMHVAPGEVVGLLGANGAGKTTLIRMLLGLLTTTAGSVEVLGGPPDRAHRRRIGYVPQNLGLYRDLTATENLIGLASGVVFGLASSAARYGATRGQRDFVSHSQLVARRYDVLCKPRNAERGREMLAALAIPAL
jgi:ABC-type Na+ transport system ATPase subunit NatA